MADYRAVRFASINLGLLLFFALSPYPRWMVPNGTIQVTFFITTLIAIAQGKYWPSPEKKWMFISILVYITYFTLPIIHQFNGGHFLYYLVFLEILFFDKDVYLDGYLILRKIIVLVCICALLVWFLHLLGFHLPFYEYDPDFRHSQLDKYHIYGPCISLYRGPSFIGGGLERICGVFAEPGHFGIYLGLLMAIEKFEFDSKENLVMLLTGILTFSTAFYGILCFGIAYRLLTDIRKIRDIRNIVVVALILFPLIGINSTLYNGAIGRVIEKQDGEELSVSSMIDKRTTGKTQSTYLRFSASKQFLMGKGNVEKDEIQITNWRGYIFRFGVIGAMIALLLVLSITSNRSVLYQALLISIALLIFSHRSYIMYHPGIYMMLFIANMLSGKWSDFKEEIFS